MFQQGFHLNKCYNQSFIVPRPQKELLTKAVNSCGLEISFGAIVPSFDGPDCLEGTGVLSLSLSVDFEGVAGTLRGCAEAGFDMSGSVTASKFGA